ncbi:hypothetical protein SAMN05660900_00527 [Megasphaera cerevisiae DSM 20462]|jgi:hypothetical protein|nr:hypothetical protein SAMN05660900_00527 [Megasphaera cerevisiae DSM 20462]
MVLLICSAVLSVVLVYAGNGLIKAISDFLNERSKPGQ